MNFNTLWIGSNLSNLESLSLRSHLKVGHKVVLWTFGQVQGVPEGVVVQDAREILSEKDVFAYQSGEGAGSYSACSNLFRYKMLLEIGGWWVDTDVVALKAFDFDEPYVFASEQNRNGSCNPTTCVMKVPAGSDVMRYCWDKAKTIERKTVQWGTIGPKLLTKAVFSLNLEEYARSPATFCPVEWFIAEKDPVVPSPPDISRSYAVHLWHEMWRRARIDKNGVYDPECLFERLKRDILRT